jgi:hypothetical protein
MGKWQFKNAWFEGDWLNGRRCGYGRGSDTCENWTGLYDYNIPQGQGCIGNGSLTYTIGRYEN